MKVIGIIPARYGSTRLTGKPLIQFHNKPLIQITYEAIVNSKLFDSIFIATESKIIKKKVMQFGGQCIMTSKAAKNGTERCAELIKKMNHDINKDDIFQISASMEGHPDNVGPAIFGGITIGYNDDNDWYISPVKYSKNLKIISFVSDQKILTKESRKGLPDSISREDSVYNISRSALLINSISNNNFDDFKYAFQDKVHEQYRTPKIKGFKTISNAAISAGALATYLSGSGPTISAIAESKELTINYEMLDAANKLGINGEGIICKISESGVQLIDE